MSGVEQITYELSWQDIDDPIHAQPHVFITTDSGMLRFQVERLREKDAQNLRMVRVTRETMNLHAYMNQTPLAFKDLYVHMRIRAIGTGRAGTVMAKTDNTFAVDWDGSPDGFGWQVHDRDAAAQAYAD